MLTGKLERRSEVKRRTDEKAMQQWLRRSTRTRLHHSDIWAAGLTREGGHSRDSSSRLFRVSSRIHSFRNRPPNWSAVGSLSWQAPTSSTIAAGRSDNRFPGSHRCSKSRLTLIPTRKADSSQYRFSILNSPFSDINPFSSFPPPLS